MRAGIICRILLRSELVRLSIMMCNRRCGIGRLSIMMCNRRCGIDRLSIMMCTGRCGIGRLSIIMCSRRCGIGRLSILIQIRLIKLIRIRLIKLIRIRLNMILRIYVRSSHRRGSIIWCSLGVKIILRNRRISSRRKFFRLFIIWVILRHSTFFIYKNINNYIILK